jgi:hypothetical protein
MAVPKGRATWRDMDAQRKPRGVPGLSVERRTIQRKHLSRREAVLTRSYREQAR